MRTALESLESREAVGGFAGRKARPIGLILGAFVATRALAIAATHLGHIQGYHRRHLSLLGALVAFFAFETDPDYYLVTIACLFVAVKMIRTTPAWQWITAWFLLLLPLATGTLQSMIRYQAVNLPLLCGAATLFSGRAFRWLFAACLVLMLFEAFLFGKGIGHN